jgi:N-acetylmuramoyl-L-alanine amidase
VTGSGLVVDGLRLAVPGVRVVNFLDDARLRLKIGEDGTLRPRGARVQAVVLHTTRGAPDSDDHRAQQLRPGAGPSTRAGFEVVADWTADHRCAGAHLVIDFDGVVYCLADLVREESFHATSVNARTIGIELKQGRDCELYAEQLSVMARVVDWITADLGIQRQIPDRYRGPVERLEAGGADFYGVFGHRDQTDRRGEGDPGDLAMAELGTRGYERFNLRAGDDREVWRKRQAALGFGAADCDGIPGPKTVDALRRRGYQAGLWACPPSERAA